MRSKRILVALIVAVMALSLSACNSGLALYVNVNVGDSYKYHIEMDQTMNVEQSGQSVETNQNMVYDFIVSVNDVDSEGNITADYKYDALKIDIESNGAKQSFDSKNANADDSMSAIYSSFIGKGFTAKMTKYGEIKEISGVDNLLNSIVDSMDLGEDEVAQVFKEQTKESLRQSFGDEAIKSAVQSATVFPDTESIKVGDTWTVDNSVKTIVDMKMTTTYTLDKVEGEIAYISVKADYKSDPSTASDYMGMQMTTDLSGTMTGSIKVNTKNGFLSEGQMTQEYSGKMSIVVPAMEGLESQTVEIPMDSKGTITYSTTKM
ncbi:DUF6263 family protein [Acetivibrio mesophilus]|uniref:DUF5105 domain-containing protein n=1 Tax=Acetivibrio mesophilus TaxID=2487273 RepID=A0A4Q0I464_9FIRM|nr:DUF6263 family protein [Acetivibrio mesophilus]ODM26115.1 hypothetical protein A7W90_07650 [Clostridium sp. Bc-iso-3]RXE59083.1 hypothetical protein EFD62_08955 [Acetivibrio mesophilus]HHV29487.1 hypothetical protein [Clostridium sp.]